jgi:hypothetical protein
MPCIPFCVLCISVYRLCDHNHLIQISNSDPFGGSTLLRKKKTKISLKPLALSISIDWT